MAFTFDPATGAYRAADGAVVPETALRAGIEALIQQGQARIAVVSQRLAEGAIDRLTWRTAMEAELRQVGGASAMLAHGGRAQMDASARGWLGAQLRTQYDYLSGFALDLAQGAPLDGRFLARAQMYAESGWSVYQAGLLRTATGRGETEGRSVLGGARDHCSGCLTEAGKGWVLLTDLVPVGARQCVSRCRCHIETRARAEVAV